MDWSSANLVFVKRTNVYTSIYSLCQSLFPSPVFLCTFWIQLGTVNLRVIVIPLFVLNVNLYIFNHPRSFHFKHFSLHPCACFYSVLEPLVSACVQPSFIFYMSISKAKFLEENEAFSNWVSSHLNVFCRNVYQWSPMQVIPQQTRCMLSSTFLAWYTEWAFYHTQPDIIYNVREKTFL